MVQEIKDVDNKPEVINTEAETPKDEKKEEQFFTVLGVMFDITKEILF